MKAIMYHYVCDPHPALPKLKYLSKDNFRKQLNYFKKTFGLVSKKEWENFVTEGGFPTKNGKVILTFDDGLRCHFSDVYPILKEFDAWGIFYPVTQSLTQGKMLDVHKVHILCANTLGADLLSFLHEKYSLEVLCRFAHRKDYLSDSYQGQSDDQNITQFKRIMNYLVDENHKAEILDTALRFFNLDWLQHDYYLTPSNIQDMQRDGMIIGNHTHTHTLLSKVSYEKQFNEIYGAQKELESIGVVSETFCFPYGGRRSFNHNTVSIIRELGFKYCFSVEKRSIRRLDWELNRFALPRYDCNQFKYGLPSV